MTAAVWRRFAVSCLIQNCVESLFGSTKKTWCQILKTVFLQLIWHFEDFHPTVKQQGLKKKI